MAEGGYDYNPAFDPDDHDDDDDDENTQNRDDDGTGDHSKSEYTEPLIRRPREHWMQQSQIGGNSYDEKPLTSTPKGYQKIPSTEITKDEKEHLIKKFSLQLRAEYPKATVEDIDFIKKSVMVERNGKIVYEKKPGGKTYAVFLVRPKQGGTSFQKDFLKTFKDRLNKSSYEL